MSFKSKIRHIITLIYLLVGRNSLHGNKGKTRVLVFHHLDKPARFENIIVQLKRKYNFVSLDDYFSGRVSKKRINLIIAFDDGYKSWFTHGIKIIKEHGFQPLLFINSDFIGLSSENAYEYCRQNIKTWPEESLDWGQLQQLRNAGCLIGGHCHTHTDLTEGNLTPRDIVSLLEKDKEKISNELKQDINIFAYPFGRWNDSAVRAVADSGYRYAFTSDSGYLDDSDGNLKFRRTNVGMRSPWIANAYAAGCAERLTADLAKLRAIFNVY